MTLGPDLDALLKEIGSAAHTVGGHAEVRPHYHEVLVIYDRCRGLFKAVHTLVRAGLGEEALILTRPMFTESLMLMNIAAADEPTRLGRLARWSLASLDDFAGVMREGEARGRDESESLANIAKRRATIVEYARKFKAALPKRWPPNEKQLADRHDAARNTWTSAYIITSCTARVSPPSNDPHSKATLASSGIQSPAIRPGPAARRCRRRNRCCSRFRPCAESSAGRNRPRLLISTRPCSERRRAAPRVEDQIPVLKSADPRG